MNQTGYLIARNRAKSEFFTAKSAYDRAQWTPLTEATVYLTAELAQAAVTKLFRNGCYEARIVPVSEFHLGNKNVQGTDEDPHNVNQYPKGDLVTNPGSSSKETGSDEMVADQHEDVCPTCGHEPCTCTDSSDEGTEDDMTRHENDYEHEEEEKSAKPAYARGNRVLFQGKRYKVHTSNADVAQLHPEDAREGNKIITARHDQLQRLSSSAETDVQGDKLMEAESFEEVDARFKALIEKQRKAKQDGKNEVADKLEQEILDLKPLHARLKAKQLNEAEFKMPARPEGDAKPSENKTTAADYKSGADIIKFNQPAMTDAKVDFGGDPLEDKVTVPAEVLSDLKAKIAEYEKIAEFSNQRDDARASFALTAAEAMKSLLADLEEGTVGSIRRAQLNLVSWMSPIVNNVPPSVQKFIYKGGKKPTLRDIFDEKKLFKKIADETQ